jgi:hypothetical protein
MGMKGGDSNHVHVHIIDIYPTRCLAHLWDLSARVYYGIITFSRCTRSVSGTSYICSANSHHDTTPSVWIWRFRASSNPRSYTYVESRTSGPGSNIQILQRHLIAQVGNLGASVGVSVCYRRRESGQVTGAFRAFPNGLLGPLLPLHSLSLLRVRPSFALLVDSLCSLGVVLCIQRSGFGRLNRSHFPR